MIAHLTGQLREKSPNQIVVDVSGVGYEVTIPLSTFYELGEVGSMISLRIHTHVREDVLALFGFNTIREKVIFEKLIAVSGIGPKLAIAVLSGISTDDLIHAVQQNDVPKLTHIPGIGRKTAERLVLELRDKLPTLEGEAAAVKTAAGAGAEATPLKEDVISALVNLGYQRALADKAYREVMLNGNDPHPTFESILKKSLQFLTR